MSGRFDSVIRFLIYVAVFWLPYSPAVVEVCVIAALLVWLMKRSMTALPLLSHGSFATGKERIIAFVRSYRPHPTKLDGPIVVFLFACLASISGSAFFSIALRGFLTKTLEWFAVYFLVVESFKTKRQVEIFVMIWIFTAGASALDALQQFLISGKDIFFGRELQPEGRVTAAFKTPNSLGGYLTIVIPMTVGMAVSSVNNRKILIASLMFLLFVTALALTGSRGAWIGVCCGLFVIGSGALLAHRQKIVASSKKWFLIGGASIMLALIFFNAPSMLRTETIGWRVETWRITIKMIRDQWLFGHGLNTFMRVFDVYRGDWTNPTYAHNCYLQLAAETGLLGLIAFLTLMGFFFWEAYVVLVKFSRLENFWLVLGLSAGVFAFLAHSFVDTNWYSLQLSVYLWLTIGLREAIILNKNEVNHGRA